MIRGNGSLDAIKTPMIIGSVECDEPSKDVLMAQGGARELSMIGKYMNCFHWLPMRIIRGQDAKLENQLGCEYDLNG